MSKVIPRRYIFLLFSRSTIRTSSNKFLCSDPKRHPIRGHPCNVNKKHYYFTKFNFPLQNVSNTMFEVLDDVWAHYLLPCPVAFHKNFVLLKYTWAYLSVEQKVSCYWTDVHIHISKNYMLIVNTVKTFIRSHKRVPLWMIHLKKSIDKVVVWS